MSGEVKGDATAGRGVAAGRGALGGSSRGGLQCRRDDVSPLGRFVKGQWPWGVEPPVRSVFVRRGHGCFHRLFVERLLVRVVRGLGRLGRDALTDLTDVWLVVYGGIRRRVE